MPSLGTSPLELRLRRIVRDPLVQAVMQADRVDEAELLTLLRHICNHLAARRADNAVDLHRLSGTDGIAVTMTSPRAQPRQAARGNA